MFIFNILNYIRANQTDMITILYIHDDNLVCFVRCSFHFSSDWALFCSFFRFSYFRRCQHFAAKSDVRLLYFVYVCVLASRKLRLSFQRKRYIKRVPLSKKELAILILCWVTTPFSIFFLSVVALTHHIFLAHSYFISCFLWCAGMDFKASHQFIWQNIQLKGLLNWETDIYWIWLEMFSSLLLLVATCYALGNFKYTCYVKSLTLILSKLI